MGNIRSGAIRLFRIAGIDVFLHWSWFLIAAYEITGRQNTYTSVGWNALEYLSLFVIVTVHEFGHALACRQVGGSSKEIVLWPLGGVAYVNPPSRPGATLWSIAAGPLVNVALAPILWVLLLMSRSLGWQELMPNAYHLIWAVFFINVGLLVFNLLPIYPLDGGQIVQCLLWFSLGQARSLMVATIIGFAGVAGLILVSVAVHSVWIGVIALFVLMNCWGGLSHARALSRRAKLPRHDGFACPSCKSPPQIGPFWTCGRCRKPFDIFQTHGACPNCAAQFAQTVCLDCGRLHPIGQWVVSAVSA
jgi:Zn-dependent protease